ncbi:MAG: SDR family oxidoreductase [Ktedonobacteraceae bacterium]
MKIALFGATGKTGGLVLGQALPAGLEVTAVVRNPAKLAMQHPNLHVVKGDALKLEEVQQGIRGQDAVVSVIGARTLKPDTICSDSARNIIAAMKSEGIRRFVCISGAGLGDNAGFIISYIFRPLILKNVYADALAQDALIQASGLDWTIVRPYRLDDGAATQTYKTSPFAFPSPLLLRYTSRVDVADFMVKEVQQGKFIQKIAFVSTRSM